jgi:hypothetical protein
MVRLLAAVTLLCLGACEQARGKQTAPAATPASPLAPLLLRFRDSAAALGPLKFEGTAHTALREGDKLLTALDESFAIEVAGAMHAQYLNSRDAGRELYADRGTVWVRGRSGKFNRRPPTDDEIARTLDDVYASLAAQTALVADGTTVTDGGPATAMGRPGKKLLLTRGGSRIGEAILDDKTGTVLSARLNARVALAGGRTLELQCTHTLSPFAGPIEPPGDAEAVATPTRSADTEDREELLRGLAPPVVKRK